MANIRLTIGAVFGAVVATADTVTNTLGAANTSVGMLNRSVNDAAERQAVRADYDRVVFKATVKQEKAKELTTSRFEIKAFCDQSQTHTDMFSEALSELEAAVK